LVAVDLGEQGVRGRFELCLKAFILLGQTRDGRLVLLGLALQVLQLCVFGLLFLVAGVEVGKRLLLLLDLGVLLRDFLVFCLQLITHLLVRGL